jgi:hypothetical protein
MKPPATRDPEDMTELENSQCGTCGVGKLVKSDQAKYLVCDAQNCLAIVGDTWLSEDWLGDEADGCYVRVYESWGDKFMSEVIVDSETGSFVDTLGCTGDFDTEAEARAAGRSMAFDWCVENGVSMEEDAA